MRHIYIASFLLLLALVASARTQVAQNRVLVLLEDLNLQHTHSIFFSQLKERGYQLNFFSADDPSLALTEYGEYLYDQLILFAPTIDEFGGLIDVPSILDFIDDGHNLLLVADIGVSDPIREIASECGVEFDEENTRVIDHLNFDIRDFDGYHDLIVIDPSTDKDQITQNKVVLPTAQKHGPILYKGITQSLEGSLNFPILTGSHSSYSANIKSSAETPRTIGKETVLVSALQARNNARVVISGSLSLFSDRFFASNAQKFRKDSPTTPKASGNHQFTLELSQWVFNERGVLKASNIRHYLAEEKVTPSVYTIKQDVTYEIELQEWNGNSWVPFVTDGLQLEVIMLDPYIRTSFKANTTGRYSVTFKLPDVYGVFTFKVLFEKEGYSSLEINDRIPVRPFRHNEYERFIPTAYPYYASCFSMLVGLFLFTVVYLFSK